MSEQNSSKDEQAVPLSPRPAEHEGAPHPPASAPPPLPYVPLPSGDPGRALQYRATPPYRSTLGMVPQLGIGLGAWIALVVIIAMASAGLADLSPVLMLMTWAAMLVGFIFFCIHIRKTYQWRGFVPGVLIGVGLTCLLPVGILAIMCANL